MDYVKSEKAIRYSNLVSKSYSLSSAQYASLDIKNKNAKPVRDFLSRKLGRVDLGIEIGSLSYVDKSDFWFVKTKSLQDYLFIPEFVSDAAQPMRPQDFIQKNLKKYDLLISKDSNIGEVVLLDKDYPRHMVSGAIYRLPVRDEWRFYLFAMMKHALFKQQLDFLVPKGATIRHAKTLFLDCRIPIPNKNCDEIVGFISLLVKSIVNKESLIRKRHADILNLIEKELQKNQNKKAYVHTLPKISEIAHTGRLDVCLYDHQFKDVISLVRNYKKSYSNIYQLGFSLSRGQNLQVSNIGKSIYSDKPHEGFYTLVLPMFLSRYGTINEVKYLGNPRRLKTLKKGDLIFGAEGFEKGRSIVVIEESKKAITNIHGLTIRQEKADLNKAIFVKCFLDYLRSKGLVDLFAVGGNGGSLAEKYWDDIPFPNFDLTIQESIVKLYRSQVKYDYQKLTLDNFEETDSQFDSAAGIYELNESLTHLKKILNNAIESIIQNKNVKISFSEQ